MRIAPATKTLSSALEIEAVASPLRVEILEQLRHLGPSSVADLSRAMGRQATALHYHVRLLHTAGLLKAAGQRTTGRRPEVLYGLTAPCFAVVGRASSARSLDAAARTMSATLRLAQREATRAVRSGQVIGAGRRRNLHVRRLRAPVTPAARARVNRLLDELERLFSTAIKQKGRARRKPSSSASAKAEEILALTFVLAPAGAKKRSV